MKRPELLLVAGPNGSGKTTVTKRLRQDRWSDDVEYLNPDEVAKDRFGDWNSPQAVVAAANWVTARREELLSQRKGIALETVLSTSEKIEFVRRAHAAGYFVRVFFVGTTTPTINAARIAARVMGGGHTVPIEKVVSRYAKSLSHLPIAIALAARVYLFDNSIDGDDARLCVRTTDGKIRKIYLDLPDWVANAIAGFERHTDFVDLRAA